MKLVVLGSYGYRPNELGHTACYAIPELGLVLDAVTGMFRMADYLQTTQLDVYLSHSHPDHSWDWRTWSSCSGDGRRALQRWRVAGSS